MAIVKKNMLSLDRHVDRSKERLSVADAVVHHLNIVGDLLVEVELSKEIGAKI